MEREREMTLLHGRPVSTFRATILFESIYFTSDPCNLQAIFKTQFNDFVMGPRAGAFKRAIGDGILGQDGKSWQHSRSLFRSGLNRERVSDLRRFETHFQALLKVMPVSEKGWTGETNIQQLFLRFTIDVATDLLFGESTGSQLGEAGLDKEHDAVRPNETNFARDFDCLQAHLVKSLLRGSFWWTHFNGDYRKARRAVSGFIHSYVERTHRIFESGLASKEAGCLPKNRTFLENLAMESCDSEEIRGQLMHTLLGGRDTTASLLSWFIHQLLRHPAVFTKLRDDIIERFGVHDSTELITAAKLKDFTYLQHCLNETLRLWPPSALNLRQTCTATTLPMGGGPNGDRPVMIPKGTMIHISPHNMHRSTKIWGKDAAQFKPERFEHVSPGWKFLPFGGGPRLCPGQHLAKIEAGYVIVRLLQHFDAFEPGLHELQGPVACSFGVVNFPAKPVTLRMHRAKSIAS
ncbi:hypothetical protein Q7P36_005912 [Cladosporium allicinum]